MHFDQIEPLCWIAAIAAMYGAIGIGAVTLLAAVRLRPSREAAIAIPLVVAGALVMLLWRGAGPLRLFLPSTLVLIALLAYYRLAIRPRMGWAVLKANREDGRQTALHLILLSGSLVFLVPFAWLVVTSLKEDKEMSQFPPVWIPTQQVMQTVNGAPRGLATSEYRGRPVKVAVMEEMDTGDRRLRIVAPPELAGTEFTVDKARVKEIRHFAPVWKNYPEALRFLPPETHFGLMFLANTLQVTLLSILGTLLSSSMVAYSFARLRWPGRDTLFMVLLATMMLPSAVTMMPVFLIFRWLGWVDTLKVLWAPSFLGAAFSIFLLRQFFLSIPTELEDAAKIDGCSYFGTFWRIMLPQIKPALAALTILTFMGAWNDFRGPLIYISSQDKEPLAYALQLFQTAHSGEPALLMAASTLVMIPVLVLFFFTQRYFIQGITLTGIKG
jgi:multiple sugar transport system permease protein